MDGASDSTWSTLIPLIYTLQIQKIRKTFKLDARPVFAHAILYVKTVYQTSNLDRSMYKNLQLFLAAERVSMYLSD